LNEGLGLNGTEGDGLGAAARGSVLVTIALNPRALLAPFAVWVIMIVYQSGYDTR